MTNAPPLLVVHRDVGLPFPHVDDSLDCPCCPHVFEITEDMDGETLAAEIERRERRQ